MVSSFSFSPTVVGFIIDGHYNDQTMGDLYSKVHEKLDYVDSVSLYLEDLPSARFSLSTLIKSIKFKMAIANRVGKVAVVTDRNWIYILTSLEKLLFPGQMQIFSSKNRLDAIQWISF